MSAPARAVRETKVPLMVYLPPQLRDRFKLLCASNGESMNAVVLAFIEDLVARHSPRQDT